MDCRERCKMPGATRNLGDEQALSNLADDEPLAPLRRRAPSSNRLVWISSRFRFSSTRDGQPLTNPLAQSNIR